MWTTLRNLNRQGQAMAARAAHITTRHSLSTESSTKYEVNVNPWETDEVFTGPQSPISTLRALTTQRSAAMELIALSFIGATAVLLGHFAVFVVSTVRARRG
jgi:hypothetical protein